MSSLLTVKNLKVQFAARNNIGPPALVVVAAMASAADRFALLYWSLRQSNEPRALGIDSSGQFGASRSSLPQY